MNKKLKIGNAQGFWGDRVNAAARLVAEQPDLDYITMDYLAEVTMSILAMQKESSPSLGYPRDFLEEIRSLIPFWKNGSKVKVIANSGGLNPEGCAQAVSEILALNGLSSMKVGVVSGDDVLPLLKSGGDFFNMDTGESIKEYQNSLVSANAYFGAKPIVEALKLGADIVITGRVADPSLVVAGCVFHYDWKWEDYNRLAAATIAGHLIECGTQATGGISTNWLKIPNPASIGFPVIEMEIDGTFVLTKPENTGGCVNEQTVKEQLLYEIGDPNNYLSPDVTVSFLGLSLEADGENRIKVQGSAGRAPKETLKVSATYRSGYAADGTLTLFGRNVQEKAERCGEVVLERVKKLGFLLEKTNIECIGCGAVVPGVSVQSCKSDFMECVLRIAVRDKRKEAVQCFAKELVPLVTSGAQAITGYFGGRPKVRPVFGFWPCLIPASALQSQVKIIEVKPS